MEDSDDSVPAPTVESVDSDLSKIPPNDTNSILSYFESNPKAIALASHKHLFNLLRHGLVTNPPLPTVWRRIVNIIKIRRKKNNISDLDGPEDEFESYIILFTSSLYKNSQDRDLDIALEALRAFPVFGGATLPHMAEYSFQSALYNIKRSFSSPKLIRTAFRVAFKSIAILPLDELGQDYTNDYILYAMKHLLDSSTNPRTIVVICRDVSIVFERLRRDGKDVGIKNYLSIHHQSSLDRYMSTLMLSTRFARTLEEQIAVFECLLCFPMISVPSSGSLSTLLSFFELPLQDSVAHRMHTRSKTFPTLQSLAARNAITSNSKSLFGSQSILPQACMEILRTEYENFSGFKFMNAKLRQLAFNLLSRLLNVTSDLQLRSKIDASLDFLKSLTG